MLDTLAIARTLTDAGMDRDQAGAVTAAVQQAAEHGDHVTRQDLDTLRADVRSEIAQAVATLTWRLALGAGRHRHDRRRRRARAAADAVGAGGRATWAVH